MNNGFLLMFYLLRLYRVLGRRSNWDDIELKFLFFCQSFVHRGLLHVNSMTLPDVQRRAGNVKQCRYTITSSKGNACLACAISILVESAGYMVKLAQAGTARKRRGLCQEQPVAGRGLVDTLHCGLLQPDGEHQNSTLKNQPVKRHCHAA